MSTAKQRNIHANSFPSKITQENIFALHEETFRSSFMLLIAVVLGRWLSKNCLRDFKERFPQDGCQI